MSELWNHEMTPAIEAWLLALESGMYAQASGKLRDETGYCCLGVACEAYRVNTAQGEWRDNGPLRMTFEQGASHENNYLAELVYTWLSLSSPNPLVRIHRDGACIEDSLAECNDSLHLTFKTIAAIIRANMAGKVYVIDGPETGQLVDWVDAFPRTEERGT